MKNTDLVSQTVPAFLSIIREPIRKCFESNVYIVTGEVTQIKPWQDCLYVRLSGRQEHRSQEITVFIRGEITDSCRLIPEEGMNLQVTGTIGLVRNEIQITVLRMEETGRGQMQERIRAWEINYQHLIQRGKKELPVLCTRIAVISSANAQGYEDFKKHLTNGEAILFECRMQGEYAAADISKAVKEINNTSSFDCICIVRGGGSFTDLFTYNMPEVMEAIAGSILPVAVAVGHDSDHSLCDKVADASFSTPTALALELSNRKKQYINAKSQTLRDRTAMETQNRHMIVGVVIIAALISIIGYLLLK